MKVIIYAHPDNNSFNHAMLETVKSTLDKAGEKYEMIDLYSEGYDPVISTEEVRGKVLEKTIHYQKKISSADTLIFIFPVFWFRAPAMMEGFIDRTFTPGFAYKYKKLFGVYGIPIRLLKNKKAAIQTASYNSARL